MPDWPLRGDGQRIEAAGVVAANSRGTTVASSATAHTKGSWVELKDSTPFPAQAIILNLGVYSSTAARAIWDIGIGAAASEKVLLPNIIHDVQIALASAYYGSVIVFPLAVPAGVRLSARVQDQAALAIEHTAHVQLLGQGFLPSQPFGRLTDYGVDASNSRGTLVTAGASSGVKGSYGQIVASTTNPIRAFYLIVGRGGGTVAKTIGIMDIAIGAAASEKIIVPDLQLGAETLHDYIQPQVIGPIPCSIPAGTRLSARTAFTTGYTPLYAAIYGLD